MIKTQNLAYNRPPPLLTLPTQHTTATHPAPSPTHYHTPPHLLHNISPPIRLPFHCTLIPHHSILSLMQPSHPEWLNPFILLKHLHSHHKHIILLFPASSSHLNPQYPGWVPANDTKGHNCEWPCFFMGSDAQCTTTIEQHDVGDESNSSFQGQTN